MILAFAAILPSVPLQHMKDILPHVEPGVLVVFDIDNTVVEPVQTLGSDQWFYHLMQRVKEEEKLDDEHAIDRAMEIWNAVQKDTEVRAVESDTPALIRDLQKGGIDVIALTARTLDSAEITKAQLRSIGVDFGGAIVFAGEKQGKGDVLVTFMKKTGRKPKRVLFIDDKEKNVESVDRSLTAASIPHLVFRYGAADERVAKFRADVADMQYRWWRHILSDDAAQDLLDPQK
jgi:hypothetical protein